MVQSANGGDYMNDNNKEFGNEYNSLKEVIGFQDDTYDSEHYADTDNMPFSTLSPRRAMFEAVIGFIGSGLILAAGLYMFFSDDVHVTSLGLIESDIVNKLIMLIIMLVISSFFFFVSVAYLKKAKKRHRKKGTIGNENFDDTLECEILQQTCPKCGKSHDFDYPKCPYCKYDYLK